MDNKTLQLAILRLRVAIFQAVKTGHDLATNWVYRMAFRADKAENKNSCNVLILQELSVFCRRLAFVFRDPPGIRTQDPNIKSVVLYLLS